MQKVIINKIMAIGKTRDHFEFEILLLVWPLIVVISFPYAAFLGELFEIEKDERQFKAKQVVVI